MAVLQGSDFLLHVETAVAATYVIVNDMNSFSKSGSRDTARTPVFGRATPYTSTAPKEATYDVGGLFNPTDPGQIRLREAEANNTPIKIKVMYDGVNGFTQEVKVSSFEYSATPEGFQEYGFEFAANADAVIVGTGPIM